jgi:hypothetical protein
MNSGRSSTLLLILLAALVAVGIVGWGWMSSRGSSAPGTVEVDLPTQPAESAAVRAPVAPVEAPAAGVPENSRAADLGAGARALADTAQLELSVLNTSGAPVVGAKLLLFRAEHVLAKGTTDAR